MKPLLVYVTTKNENEAKTIAKHILKKKLASCANIVPAITSSYWWKGTIEHDTEAVLLLKTFDNHYDQVEKAIKDAHSYTTPCIVALPIEHGSKEYLEWSKNECI